MKLDVGCGLHTKEPLDEWTHLDIDKGPHIEIVADFGDVPLDDNSVDQIHIGDVIEHIPVWRQTEVLAEWKRLLKPGGVLEGNTPNLAHAIHQYVAGEIGLDWLLQNLYGDRAGFQHQHYILFTMASLSKLLTDHGFVDLDLSGSPGPHTNPWWIVFEARKP